MKHIKADVLVIGGGLAGLMAAKHAADAGLCPLILADGQGASPWVHGFNAPVHPEDSVETFFQDTMVSGRGVNDAALGRTLCDEALASFEEVRALGLSFNRKDDGYQLLKPLGSSYPRVVSIGNHTGPAIMEKLWESLDGRSERMEHSRALRLRVENGRVLGALAYDQQAECFVTIEAKGVVLACGGFCGIYPFSTNKRDSGGDGIAMAYEAGCRLVDMEFVQFEPSAAVWPEPIRGLGMITTMFYDGAVLRDKDGVRFMLEADAEKAERVNKDVMAKRIANAINQGRGTEHGGVYFDATGVGAEKLNKDYPAYVKRYENVGMDISREMMEIAPAPHTSLGGVMVTPDCRTDVAGLYACGEIMGGLHGANRLGGSAGLEILVFGRRAGETCAADVKELPTVSDGWELWAKENIENTGENADAQELRKQMQNALASGAGVLRNEKTMVDSVKKLEKILKMAYALSGTNGPEGFVRLRLINDVQTAILVCKGALERKESLGCHTLTDNDRAMDEPYRIIHSKNGLVKQNVL